MTVTQEVLNAANEIVMRFSRDKTLHAETRRRFLDSPDPFADLSSFRAVFGIGPIRHNRIRCLACDDVIESENRHNYIVCSCGASAVDGGTWELQRSGTNFEELSEMWPDVFENEKGN